VIGLEEHKRNETVFSWMFRLMKGIIIGTGFIIPGVSGGVFAAIFGVYEPMIRFFANIRKNFLKNVKFLLPIGIGVLISIVLVSKVFGGFFEIPEVEVPMLWFFIGCVTGTLPRLNKQAGQQGRQSKHIAIFAITIVLMFAFLHFIQDVLKTVTLPTEGIYIWLAAGALMGLGAIVPGLSPSNFLLYMGIYGEMMQRMGNLDFTVLAPVVVGALACFLLLSKVFDRLFECAYTSLYHFILGVIITSTMMIIPWSGKELESGGFVRDINFTLPLVLICVGTCVAGIALGYWMDTLEKKYKG